MIMVLSKNERDKVFLMEEVVNFPTSLLRHPSFQWKNLPMVPYSNLKGAVVSLMEGGKKVAIITGFYIPGGDPPATETDGPPGALILAEGLYYLGMEVMLISDPYTIPALKAGLKILGLTEREVPILTFPMEHHDENHTSRMDNEEANHNLSVNFVREFLSGPTGRDLSHLVYIERVGPNHTLESFLSQDPSNPGFLKEFEALLPSFRRNRCYNSRLDDITRFTGKTHLLIEVLIEMKLPIETIGVADRGNEIGSGRVPWKVFMEASEDHRESIFGCRIKTDYLITCGVSNWGGYALWAGVALARGRPELLEKVTPEQEGRVLNHLVQHGPAIDGITRRQDASVDGIGFDAYMQVIERIKEIALE